jgi:hypothetical protein
VHLSPGEDWRHHGDFPARILISELTIRLSSARPVNLFSHRWPEFQIPVNEWEDDTTLSIKIL